MTLSESISEVWHPADEMGSKTHTFLSYLADHGLLAGRPLSNTGDNPLSRTLSDRNKDRVRILKRLSTSPSGLAIKTVVSECIKGQRVGQCQRIDGSDPDYQFAYSYLTELSDTVPQGHDHSLLRKRKENGTLIFAPRTSLIDLISEGITQTTTSSDAPLTDREFALDVVKHSKSLNDNQKNHLQQSLESYVSRIDDYRLLFDVTTYGDDGHGQSTNTMTKPYKTRFNSEGRISKQYAQFNSALEHNLRQADNAVLVTLTTDPGTPNDDSRPDPRSIFDTTDSINENFNKLNSYLKSDPATKRDTRTSETPNWTYELSSEVTGRPRKKLEYIKVLEFTEKGYPHLHILFFDVPEREVDGMPWLIDKAELSSKWSDYGQGQIVDTYPLTKRRLDDLDAEFATDSDYGMVDWYRYGDHDRDDRWIQARKDEHELIEFSEGDSDDDEAPKESTAGAYLGKYLSATFGALMENSESLEVPDGSYEDKAATWKLALYWATQRRFWSMSRHTRRMITPNEHLRECSDLADSVRWIIEDTVSELAHQHIVDHYARQQWSDIDDLEEQAREATEAVISPNVESTLPEPANFGVLIDYLGAFAKWDLPSHDLDAPELDDSTDQFGQSHLPESPRPDRPPPLQQVWSPDGTPPSSDGSE